MRESRLNIIKTREITNPTYYVEAINQEFAPYALDEERAEGNCGNWRGCGFWVGPDGVLDFE